MDAFRRGDGGLSYEGVAQLLSYRNRGEGSVKTALKQSAYVGSLEMKAIGEFSISPVNLANFPHGEKALVGISLSQDHLSEVLGVEFHEALDEDWGPVWYAGFDVGGLGNMLLVNYINQGDGIYYLMCDRKVSTDKAIQAALSIFRISKEELAWCSTSTD